MFCNCIKIETAFNDILFFFRSYKKNFKSKTFFPNLVTLNKLSCNVLRFLAMPESVDARDFGVQDGWGIPQASKLRDIVMLSFIEASFPNLSSLQVIF